MAQSGWVATTPISPNYYTVTINETTPTDTDNNFGNRQIITTTVTLNDVTVFENQTYSYTASVNHAPQTAFTVTLNNGMAINFAAGSTTGTSAVQPAQGEDPYIDNTNFTVSIASTTGGNYEALDISDTATVTIKDTIDATTLTLNDVTVSEGTGTATIGASLDHAPTAGNLVFTLSNGQTITFTTAYVAGTTVQSTAFAIQGDDVYKDGESYSVSVDSYTGGAEFEKLVSTDTATVTINDTTDTTTVTLNDVTVNTTDGMGTILTNVDNAVTDTPLVITLSNGATVTILVGNTSGLSTPFEVLGDDTISIKNATGGNYEHLDTTDTVFQHPDFTIAKDVTSVTGGAGLSADSAGDVINYGIVLTNKRNPDGCDIKRSICHGNRCNRVN